MRDKRFLFWIVLAVVIVGFLSLPERFEQSVSGWARELSAPIQSGLSVFGRRLKEASAVIRGLGGMAARNQEMRQELARLRNEVRVNSGLSEANSRLRAALGLTRRMPGRLIPCEVIGRDAAGWWRTVRVSKDSESQFAVDSVAITADGLVGKLVSTSRNTADLLLISDPTCRVSARIERLKVSGVLQGRRALIKGRALCRMTFINKDAEVRIGDEVETSGLGGVFPRGIMVGRISKIYQDDSGLYQYADVVPSVELSNLDIVFLIDPNAPSGGAVLSGGVEQ